MVMIALGQQTLKRSLATWHTDFALNQRQATLLAADYTATRDKLIAEAVAHRFPGAKGTLETRTEDGVVHWVIFTPESAKDKRGEALAVMTMPQTRVQGLRLVMEWHWHPVGGDAN
jgi:hypothetical protein